MSDLLKIMLALLLACGIDKIEAMDGCATKQVDAAKEYDFIVQLRNGLKALGPDKSTEGYAASKKLLIYRALSEASQLEEFKSDLAIVLDEPIELRLLFLLVISGSKDLYAQEAKECFAGKLRQCAFEIAAVNGQTKMFSDPEPDSLNLKEIFVAAVTGAQTALAQQLMDKVYPHAMDFMIDYFYLCGVANRVKDPKKKEMLFILDKQREAATIYMLNNTIDLEHYKNTWQKIYDTDAFKEDPIFDLPIGAFRIMLTARFQGHTEYLKAYFRVKYYVYMALAHIAKYLHDTNEDSKSLTQKEHAEIILYNVARYMHTSKSDNQIVVSEKEQEACADSDFIKRAKKNFYKVLLSIIQSDLEFKQAAFTASLEKDAKHLVGFAQELPRKALEKDLFDAMKGGNTREYLNAAQRIFAVRHQFGKLQQVSMKNAEFAQIVAAYYGHANMYTDLISVTQARLLRDDLQLAFDLALENNHLHMAKVIAAEKRPIDCTLAFREATRTCSSDVLTMLTEYYPQQFVTLHSELVSIATAEKKKCAKYDRQKWRDLKAGPLSLDREQHCVSLLEGMG